MEKLPRKFYTRPTLTVARDLPGRYLCRRFNGKTMVGRIVEVEAYLGSKDPASHAYRGRTKRNSVMFRKGGFLYVYFTYGMHFCANVVTEGEGTGSAVLLRALEPIRGMDGMERNRFGAVGTQASPERIRTLCSGPGNLCRALAITGNDNGADLLGTDIWLAEGSHLGERVSTSTRVGITKGTAPRWRFFLRDNPFVSRGKPSNVQRKQTRV